MQYDNQQGGPGSYGTSIDMETALDPTCDVILAYKQNGEPLHPDHGYPVRLLIPGYIGGRMVKWLSEIEVTDGESNNYFHYNDNRVLPSQIDAEKATAEGEAPSAAPPTPPETCASDAPPEWASSLPFAASEPLLMPRCVICCQSCDGRVVVQARVHHQQPQHQRRHRAPVAQGRHPQDPEDHEDLRLRLLGRRPQGEHNTRCLIILLVTSLLPLLIGFRVQTHKP